MLVNSSAWPTSYDIVSGEQTHHGRTNLVGHELDQRNIVGVQPSLSKLLSAESCNTVVEQVKLDPFLVET
jgi:hypothetical protein